MTEKTIIEEDVPELVRPASLYWTEVRAMLRLAGPLMLTLLAQSAMMLIDVLLIGRLGEVALAGSSLGLTLFFAGFICAAGITMAVAPLAAQAHGARRPRQVRRVVRQGLWLTLAITLPTATVLSAGERILLVLGQPADASAAAGSYLATMAWALPPMIGFMTLRNFAAALDKPHLGLWVIVAALPAKALLAYALVFGEFGLPAAGIRGAGLSSALIESAMFLAMAGLVVRTPVLRRYHVFARFWRPDWLIFRRLLRVGSPIAAIFMLEFGTFAVGNIFMGWIGTTALAAHQITLQIASVTFRLAAGLAQAAVVRVGQAAGRHDAPGVRRAGWVALGLCAAIMTVTSIVILLFHAEMPWLFLGPDGDAVSGVATLAAKLLLVAAIFQLADGTQAVGAGVLRGLNDNARPLLWAAFGYWGVGMPAAYILGFELALGPVGIWSGLAVGLACVAVFHVVRFRRLTGEARLAETLTRVHVE